MTKREAIRLRFIWKGCEKEEAPDHCQFSTFWTEKLGMMFQGGKFERTKRNAVRCPEKTYLKREGFAFCRKHWDAVAKWADKMVWEEA